MSHGAISMQAVRERNTLNHIRATAGPEIRHRIRQSDRRVVAEILEIGRTDANDFAQVTGLSGPHSGRDKLNDGVSDHRRALHAVCFNRTRAMYRKI